MFSIIVQTFVNGLVLSSIYILVAIGLTLIFSIMGIVNFAHGGIIMLGAFITYFFVSNLGLPFFISLLISMGVMTVLGILIERVIFRPLKDNQLNMMVISLGLAIVLEDSALIIWGPDDLVLPFPKLGILRMGEIFLPLDRLVILLSAFALVGALYLLIYKTKVGAAIRAVSQDREAAILQGINSNAIPSLSFGIGCSLAAAAGGLIGPIFLISPYMGTLPMVKAFVVIVLGGLGSIMGAVVGGFILGIIESFGATYLGIVYQNALSFLILIIVLIFRPEGLFGGK